MTPITCSVLGVGPIRVPVPRSRGEVAAYTIPVTRGVVIGGGLSHPLMGGLILITKRPTPIPVLMGWEMTRTTLVGGGRILVGRGATVPTIVGGFG